MFQKSHPIAVRIATPSLLVVLVLALGGCSGLGGGADSELSRAVSGGYRGSETLAVLLPESGRFAGAAQVVRDGLVAAREADPQGKRPELRFYDSAAGSATELVQKAAADGASLVIGPLQKPAVETLRAASALPVPVLALNQAAGAGNPPHNLYQFALSPEDEAIEAANKAWSAGHRRALMLYPEGNWGSRISRAFLQAWKGHGGSMAATQVYDPAAVDFSDTIAGFSERAAGGDFVFLVATSTEARLIWPQIRDKLGTEMPGYSTSHVLSGRFDPQRDQALVGLSFVEIPWLIEPAKGDSVSAKGLYKKLPQLYAMGVDAYRLGSRLEWLSRNPQARIQGKTGILRMDSLRRIHRELALARIDSSGPVMMATLDTGARALRTFARRVPLYEVGPRLAAVGPSRVGGLQD